MTSEQQLETTLKAVEADMAVIGTGVTGLQTQVTALTAQVAVLVAGQPVTQDQLDALNATGSALETQTDTLAAIFAPPAAPPAA
jgi:heterodisulfide reductase subunit A-like polyferredoxin